MSSQKLFSKPSLLLLGESHDRPSTFAVLHQNLEHFVTALNFKVLALEFPTTTPGNAVNITKENVPGTEIPEISYEIATQKIFREIASWIETLFKNGRLLPDDLDIQAPNARTKINKFLPQHFINSPHFEAMGLERRSPKRSVIITNMYSNIFQRLASYYNIYKTNENFVSELLPELINGYKEHNSAYIKLLEKAQQLGVTVLGVDSHTREYNNSSQYGAREEHALMCLNNFCHQNPDAGNILMPWGAAHIGNLEKLAGNDYNASALFIYETRQSECSSTPAEDQARSITSQLSALAKLEEEKIVILKRVEAPHEEVVFNTKPLFDKLGLQPPIPTEVNNCTLHTTLFPSQVHRR